MAAGELAGVPAWEELPGSVVPVVVPCEPAGVELVEPPEEEVELLEGVELMGSAALAAIDGSTVPMLPLSPVCDFDRLAAAVPPEVADNAAGPFFTADFFVLAAGEGSVGGAVTVASAGFTTAAAIAAVARGAGG